MDRLKSLELDCVWHRGASPSPIEPPFAGLPRTLRKVIIDAWDPSVAKQALEQHLPDAQVVVDRRDDPDDGEGADGEWVIVPPESSVREWSTYGSLWDAMDAGDDETEYDAMKAAMAKLRAADPQLLASLDFDHESDGTGITAPTREALERALRILGVH